MREDTPHTARPMAVIARPMGPPKNAMAPERPRMAVVARRAERDTPVMLAVIAVWKAVRRAVATPAATVCAV